MPEPRLKMIIVDDSKSGACPAGCGADWSSPEAISAARQAIRDRFGDNVKLEYLEFSSTADSKIVRHIRSQVRGMPFPVLLANGHPRIAGEFDTRQLMDVIEADLEKMEMQ